MDGRSAPNRVYEVINGKWVGGDENTLTLSPPSPRISGSDEEAAVDGSLKISFRQDANSPVQVVASNAIGQLSLLPNDPVLEGVFISKISPFEFAMPDGQKMTAGLILPKNKPASSPPLVIAAYKYDPHQFLPDGPTSVYAAQTLAARGMAVLVLTVPSEDNSKIGKVEELTDFAQLVQAAISGLTSAGLIDRNRVGIIGFSRAGYLVSYAVTHPGPISIQAAIVEDGFPGTYSYMSALDAVLGLKRPRTNYGIGSFWNNKDSWMRHEPMFNVDSVKTPVMVTVHHQSALAFMFDTIGAYRLNKSLIQNYLF